MIISIDAETAVDKMQYTFMIKSPHIHTHMLYNRLGLPRGSHNLIKHCMKKSFSIIFNVKCFFLTEGTIQEYLFSLPLINIIPYQPGKICRKRNKPIQIGREEEMLTLFTDKITIDGIHKKYQFELINMPRYFADYKVNIKCVAFLHNSNEQLENLESNFIYNSMKK